MFIGNFVDMTVCRSVEFVEVKDFQGPKRSNLSIKVNLHEGWANWEIGEVVYRQLGDSNSQWHKQKFKKVPVGEVPVGGSAS